MAEKQTVSAAASDRPLAGARVERSARRRMLARGASARGRIATSIGAPALLGIVVLATWQYLVQSGRVSPFLLPYPGAVMRSLWDSLTQGSLGGYVAPTMVEALSGYAVGAACALPLGYGIAHSRLVASTLQPYLAASQAIPVIAIAPLIALWLGYGLLPVVVLCALIVFFPMVVNTMLGMRTLDLDLVDSARVEGAGSLRLLWYVELPLALPSILAGLRTSLTLSITGAVVGEFVVGGHGLGELLIVQRSYSDSAGVFATLLVLAALAAVLYGAIRLLESRLSYVESMR
jgi:NitT/TauT family transport system permease protein